LDEIDPISDLLDPTSAELEPESKQLNSISAELQAISDEVVPCRKKIVAGERMPCVPTIATIRSHRFFFSSSDGSEPPHVHVEVNGRVAKFWLDPVELSKSGRVADHELRRIEKLVIEHQVEFIEAWNDFFGS
jgi:hypothetical protein